MKRFWDMRYATEDYVYGRDPNGFFASEIERLSPGKILLPGEGEGRNAIYAALRSWEVEAFDQSHAGLTKAMKFARKVNVQIKYQVSGIESYSFKKNYFDAVGLIFLHTPPGLRKLLHTKVYEALKPGGIVILEAFHTSQLENSTGGPQSLEMLYHEEMLRKDFPALEVLYTSVIQTGLNEGSFHQGNANVVRFIGKKLNQH